MNTDPHTVRVVQYYLRLLQTIHSQEEQTEIVQTAFEYVFQVWPKLPESQQIAVLQTKDRLESLMAEWEIPLSKKLRLWRLFQELHTLSAKK